MILELDPKDRKDAMWQENDERVAKVAEPANNWWSLQPNYRKTSLYREDQLRDEKGRWTDEVINLTDKELYRGDTRCKGKVLSENPDYFVGGEPKNKAGYYFFTDDLEEAKLYSIDVMNENLRSNSKNPNLTTIKAKSKRILDLTRNKKNDYIKLFKIIDRNLFKGSMDFDSFLKLNGFFGSKRNMNKNLYNSTIEHYENLFKYYKKGESNGITSYYGSAITNGETGVYFKNLLKENGFDGVAFQDSNPFFNSKTKEKTTHYAFIDSNELEIIKREGCF